jgi:formylglycine-generating enzyme required for sulfatase activity
MQIIKIMCFILFLSSARLSHSIPDYINHLGIAFKIIESGVFYMGSCPPRSRTSVCLSEVGEDAETTVYEVPQHEVKIKKHFEISLHEITLAQFQPFIEDERPDLLTEAFEKINEFDKPVVYVSWEDIKAYIKWLNETKPIEDVGVYRLPTEAEWEYAARGDTQTIYWWGNQMKYDKANCNQCDNQWGLRQAAPVGYFSPNPFGLYDMNGNVREWVEDCWNRNYVSAPVNGSAWLTGNCLARVVRDGSWQEPPWLTRTTVRDWYLKDHRDATIGFRLVRETSYSKKFFQKNTF